MRSDSIHPMCTQWSTKTLDSSWFFPEDAKCATEVFCMTPILIILHFLHWITKWKKHLYPLPEHISFLTWGSFWWDRNPYLLLKVTENFSFFTELGVYCLGCRIKVYQFFTARFFLAIEQCTVIVLLRSHLPVLNILALSRSLMKQKMQKSFFL